MSTLAELLSKTKATAAARAAEADGAYRRLVKQAVTGAKLAPEKVADFLAAAGIDADQFAADAERMARRIEWARLAADLPTLRAELDATHAAGDAVTARMKEECAAAEKKAAEAMAPLVERRRQLEGAIRAGQDAEQQLRATADPAVGGRLKAASEVVEHARQAMTRARAEVDRLNKLVEAYEGNPGASWRHNTFEVAKRQVAAEGAKESLPAAESAAEEAERVWRDALHEHEQIRDQALTA